MVLDTNDPHVNNAKLIHYLQRMNSNSSMHANNSSRNDEHLLRTWYFVWCGEHHVNCIALSEATLPPSSTRRALNHGANHLDFSLNTREAVHRLFQRHAALRKGASYWTPSHK